jgi:hypothetical protein
VANENLHPTGSEVYAEPDGCLYAWCDHCETPGFTPFGSDRHFQPDELEELILVADGHGKVYVDQLPIGGLGTPGKSYEDRGKQLAFERGWRDARDNTLHPEQYMPNQELVEVYLRGFRRWWDSNYG